MINPSLAGPKPVSVIGFEYQMADDEYTPDAKRGARWSAGALYHFAPARKSRPARGEEFHRGGIVVRGMHVEHWLDGEKVVDARLDTPGLIWAEPGTYRAPSPACCLLTGIGSHRSPSSTTTARRGTARFESGG